MLLECLTCVQVLFIMVIEVSKGTVVLTVTSGGALIKGEPGILLCHISPFEAAVTWKTSAYQTGGVDRDQTTCLLSGICFPSTSVDDARYSFAASIGNGQFNGTMYISTVECATDSSTYTCSHSNAANEEDVRTFTVQVIPSAVTISESGLTITAKTDCMAESSNLQIQWFKLYDDSTEEEYNVSNLQSSNDSSACPADDCGTTEVTYSYVHTNPPEPTIEVKLKVNVWHSSNPSLILSEVTNKKYKFPGTTTTTTTTTTATTITSPTTIMTASLATAAATSSVPAATTSISTRTTKVTSTVTAPPTASSTVTFSKSTVQTPSTATGSSTPVSHRDSDKAIVTMIIVVSVTGGILLVAIFSIMFVMMHWKSCFTRRGHAKHYDQRSEHRKHHRQAEDNSSGRFLSTRQNLAIRGYYFYSGTHKNPLFYDPFENSSYVENYYPNQKNYHDPKYRSSHQIYLYN